MLLTILEIGECVLVANNLHCVTDTRQPLYRIHVSPTGFAVVLQTEELSTSALATGADSAIEVYPDYGTTYSDVLSSVPRILSSFTDALAKLDLDWSSFVDHSQPLVDSPEADDPGVEGLGDSIDELGAHIADRLDKQDPLAAVAANLVLKSERLSGPLAGRLRYLLEYAEILPTKGSRHASLLAGDLMACFRAGLDGSSDAAKELLMGGILVGPARVDLTRQLELHGDRATADRVLATLDFEIPEVVLVKLDDRGLNQLLSQSDVKSLGLTGGDNLWVSDLAGNANMIEVCFNATLKDLLWDTASPLNLVLLPPSYNLNVVQMIAKGVGARLKDSLKAPAPTTRLKDVLKAPAVAARLKARGLAPARPYKIAEITQPIVSPNTQCLTIDLTLSTEQMDVLLPQHPIERLGLKPGDRVWVGLKCGSTQPVLASVSVDFNRTLKDLVPAPGAISSVMLMCGSISGSIANDVLHGGGFSSRANDVLKSVERMTLIEPREPTVDVVKLWLADGDQGLLPQHPIRRLGVLPGQHVWLGWEAEYRLVQVDFNATIPALLRGDDPEGDLLVIFNGGMHGDVVAKRLKDILATSDSHPRAPKVGDALAPVGGASPALDAGDTIELGGGGEAALDDADDDTSELWGGGEAELDDADDTSEELISVSLSMDEEWPKPRIVDSKGLAPILAPPPPAAAEGWSAAVIVDHEGDTINISLRDYADDDYVGDTSELGAKPGPIDYAAAPDALDGKPIVSDWITSDGDIEIPSSMQVDDDWVDPYEVDAKTPLDTPTPIPDVDVTVLPVTFIALNAVLSDGASPSAALTSYARGLVADLLADLRLEAAKPLVSDQIPAPARIRSPAGTLDLAKVNDDPSPTVISVAGVKVYGCLTVIAKRKDLTTKATRVLLAMSLHRCEKYYGVIGIVVHESVSAIELIDRLLAHPTSEKYITITTIDPATGV